MLQPRAVLSIKPRACLAIDVGTTQLASSRAPVMPDDSVRHATDPVTDVGETPAEVGIRAVGEPLVKPSDRVERSAAEGEVDGGALRYVIGLLGLPARRALQPVFPGGGK